MIYRKLFVRLVIVILLLIFIFFLLKIEKEMIQVKKVTRQEAYKRAMDIINFVWEYQPREFNRQDVKLPNFLGDKRKMVVGIPYCWGGYISIDISDRKDVKNFKDAIDKGYIPGNVLTEGIYKEKTAGLDCSGFVGAVYNLPEKVSTKTLKKYFKYISIKKIKPMDIFNAEAEHTFIYLKESYDKKGIITLEARHSNSLKSKDKTVISYRTYEEIKNGQNGKRFYPMRYKGIVEDDIKVNMDSYEYNNTLDKAYKIEKNMLFLGSIDYIEDIDIFKIDVEYKQKIMLKVFQLPKDIKLTIKNADEREFQIIERQGFYLLELDKGTYYLEFKNNSLKTLEENYIFEIS